MFSLKCIYLFYTDLCLRFEPVGLAIVRGSVAVLACIGLLFFSVYSGYNQQELYSSGNRREQGTTIPLLTAAHHNHHKSNNPMDNPTLSVTAVSNWALVIFSVSHN